MGQLPDQENGLDGKDIPTAHQVSALMVCDSLSARKLLIMVFFMVFTPSLKDKQLYLQYLPCLLTIEWE